ncbi:DUF547 domain-containing protein [Reichenbachiella carrageenanivorans]|uniref:DUF547 domain-containing protein n=1 Tax=Reichenbachiella carrageenanivorans TaxID=2979869 RepID=A0ABY6D276_9BACT|nr:DUF547 domain-containing protein [Reichenbachiella carrageenanivorans]UXX80228.1 DUF547 domain-containing protein [Reichenbachiella carrageenanivorans]
MKNLIVALIAFSPLLLQAQPTHKDFDSLLKKYVDAQGGVNYKAFKADEVALNDYLVSMMIEPPTSDWNNDEKLTYWINVYNALTIQLILKYYPIKSIKDIGSAIQIPYINTPWDIECFEIEDGKELSLNDIEHGIIRKHFEEPRIHFALVCAAKSCPKLLNEAYDATKLDAQLTAQTKAFLANLNKNKISNDRLELSKLFSWYGGDFRKNGTLVDFLNQYSSTKINQKTKTSFMDYDWGLNEQK